MVKAAAGRGLPMQRLDLLKPARSVLNRAGTPPPAPGTSAMSAILDSYRAGASHWTHAMRESRTQSTAANELEGQQ